MNNGIKIGMMFIACIVMVVTFHVAVQAEEYEMEEVPQGTSSVEVYNPNEQQQLEEILLKLDALLEVQLNEQISEETVDEETVLEDEEPVATPDPYILHFQTIEEQLSDINTNTIPSTPETAESVSAFEVPFEEYSTTDALLLVLSVVALIGVLYAVVKQFI